MLFRSKKYDVDMPITRQVHACLFENKNLEEGIRALMGRELRAENESL